MITDKFSFQPRKPQEIAKRENCHRKRATEKWQLPVKFRQLRARRIYFLVNHFCDSFPYCIKAKMFFTTDTFFYPLDMENQHVRSDKNSILWAWVYAGNADL